MKKQAPRTLNNSFLLAMPLALIAHCTWSQGKKKKRITSEVTAEISIDKQPEGFGLSAQLIVEMNGVSQQEAEELVEKAHQVCPYSRAVQGNIEVRKRVVTK